MKMVSLYIAAFDLSKVACNKQTKGQQKLRGTFPRFQLNHNYQNVPVWNILEAT